LLNEDSRHAKLNTKMNKTFNDDFKTENVEINFGEREENKGDRTEGNIHLNTHTTNTTNNNNHINGPINFQMYGSNNSQN